MPEGSVQSMLPCVVEIGFAGSRRLFDSIAASEAELAEWERQLEAELIGRLKSLRSELQLDDHYFFCGVSQIAIGADMIFAKACKRLNIPQRIFLPQPRDVYLSAGSTNGEGDFSSKDRAQVEELIASPHIIQEKVVSDADNRHTRFGDCNRQILRASDMVICVFGAGTEPKPGGTDDMLSAARAQNKTVLELRIGISKGKVQLDSKWHGLAEFHAPRLPSSIHGACLASDVSGNGTLPTVSAYCDAVKSCASRQARQHHTLFSRAALMIIGTHVFATLCAAVVLGAHAVQNRGLSGAATHAIWWVVSLLGLEFLALIAGFAIHRWLHHARPAEEWAISRLLAEINRSVKALGNLHVYPAYLFNLRLPSEVAPLLRTITILHLHTTKAHASATWQTLRDAYLANRLTDPDPRQGQIAFYRASSANERRWLWRLNGAFLVCSALAIIATAVKVVLTFVTLPPPWYELCTTVLGPMAIFLPTLAVGALSWAAAKEYRARVQTFESALTFLTRQKMRLELAASRQEFCGLVHETESNLLGETADWYSRRKALMSPA